MKKTTLGIISLFSAIVSFSQSFTQTVKGQVTDQQSGSPIIGATVQVLEIDPPMGAITDVNGYYRIENVPIGRQTLGVSYLGYEPVTLPNILVGIREGSSCQYQIDRVAATAWGSGGNGLRQGKRATTK